MFELRSCAQILCLFKENLSNTKQKSLKCFVSFMDFVYQIETFWVNLALKSNIWVEASHKNVTEPSVPPPNGIAQFQLDGYFWPCQNVDSHKFIVHDISEKDYVSIFEKENKIIIFKEDFCFLECLTLPWVPSKDFLKSSEYNCSKSQCKDMF